MKKNSSISALFGFTQSQMAMLLGVSISHLSMVDSGKRSLPLHANQLLAEMLQHMKATESQSKSATIKPEQHLQRKTQLERLLRRNEYRRLVLERKIATIGRKVEARLRAARLNDFLTDNARRKTPTGKSFEKFISVPRGSLHKYEKDLLQFEINREMLELEKLVIEAKIRKSTQSLEFTGDPNENK